MKVENLILFSLDDNNDKSGTSNHFLDTKLNNPYGSLNGFVQTSTMIPI